MKTITTFTKLPESQKIAALKFEGKMIDVYIDQSDIVMVYFLNEFFVEYIMKDDDSVEIIPFKRGYKLPADFNNTYSKGLQAYYRLTA